MRLKDKTQAISKSIETGARHPIAYIDSRRYVQHNLSLEDGLGPLLEYFDQLPASQSKVNPLRALEDGDISLAHIEYHIEPYGHVVGFEIHRWEDGRIVEHWDNLQAMPEVVNASGHTMVDGPVEVVDLDRALPNKLLVEDFVRTVLIGSDASALTKFLHDDSLIEHNPHGSDGGDSLRAVLRAASDTACVRHQRLHRVIGEGNFCLTLSEGLVEGQHSAIFDLFRVAEAKIVEHWDVTEPIPARSDWKNDNGKF